MIASWTGWMKPPAEKAAPEAVASSKAPPVPGIDSAQVQQIAQSLAAVRGHQQRLREELKQQLKMAPIQAAEFLFQHLAWLTLDPKYRGTESQKLRRRLKKERGELRPPPWAIDRTEKFQKATANTSTAYGAFLCFSNVSGGAVGAVAPSSGGGAAGGASGGGAAGGGGGGAG